MKCEFCFERDGHYIRATSFDGRFVGPCVYVISCKPCIEKRMSGGWIKEFATEEEFIIDKILSL